MTPLEIADALDKAGLLATFTDGGNGVYVDYARDKAAEIIATGWHKARPAESEGRGFEIGWIGVIYDQARHDFLRERGQHSTSDSELFVWAYRRGKDALRTLSSHAPDGHNVTNAQYAEVTAKLTAAESEAERLKAAVARVKELDVLTVPELEYCGIAASEPNVFFNQAQLGDQNAKW